MLGLGRKGSLISSKACNAGLSLPPWVTRAIRAAPPVAPPPTPGPDRPWHGERGRSWPEAGAGRRVFGRNGLDEKCLGPLGLKAKLHLLLAKGAQINQRGLEVAVGRACSSFQSASGAVRFAADAEGQQAICGPKGQTHGPGSESVVHVLTENPCKVVRC